MDGAARSFWRDDRISPAESRDESAPPATGAATLGVVLVALSLAIQVVMATRSLVPLLVVLPSGPLALFLSVWVATAALPTAPRWAATIATGSALAVIFFATLDGIAGISVVAVAATAAAAASRRSSLIAVTSIFWLQIGAIVLFVD